MNEDYQEHQENKKADQYSYQNGAAREQQPATVPLAQWLQAILQPDGNEQTDPDGNINENSQVELLLHSDYHLVFYQQLPDFSMALLQDESRAVTHYAPLLFHLAGCSDCRTAYIEIYDALRAALQPGVMRPVLGQGTRTLSATPHRMLAHLCRTLINQAEAIYHQSRHDHTDESIQARSLLQLALRISSHIMQSTTRQNALHDLVRVAMLFEDAASSSSYDTTYQYSPVVTAASGVRRGRQPRQNEGQQDTAAIHLRSQSLIGSIYQQDNLLELFLHDLAPQLHGKRVSVSIILGSLIEPVRWIGGNPYDIRSTDAVDEQGTVKVSLGYTELSLKNHEDRNLLEAMFSLLEMKSIA
jgi:hypothetical protein